jgi:hypothetical protein
MSPPAVNASGTRASPALTAGGSDAKPPIPVMVPKLLVDIRLVRLTGLPATGSNDVDEAGLNPASETWADCTKNALAFARFAPGFGELKVVVAIPGPDTVNDRASAEPVRVNVPERALAVSTSCPDGVNDVFRLTPGASCAEVDPDVNAQTIRPEATLWVNSRLLAAAGEDAWARYISNCFPSQYAVGSLYYSASVISR